MKQYHSASYHRYFEDYAEIESVKPDGKRRIERIYIGEYYMQELSDRQRILRKVLYAVLYIAACALFIHAGTQNHEANLTWWVAVPETLSFMALFWLLLPMFFCMTAPQKMVIRTYRDSSENLIRISLVAAILLGVTALTAFGYTFIAVQGSLLIALLCFGEYFIASVIMFCLWRLEKKLPYATLPAQNARPTKSVVI